MRLGERSRATLGGHCWVDGERVDAYEVPTVRCASTDTLQDLHDAALHEQQTRGGAFGVAYQRLPAYEGCRIFIARTHLGECDLRRVASAYAVPEVATESYAYWTDTDPDYLL